MLAKAAASDSMVLQMIKDFNATDPKMKKLFVRNLNFETTDSDLKALFEQFGPVEEAVIIKQMGKSRGFGFVTFASADDAQKALVCPSMEVGGRTAVVSLAAMRAAAAPAVAPVGGGAVASGGAVVAAGNAGGGVTDRTKLFVRQLSYETTNESLQAHFSQFGPITEAVVVQNRDTGGSKGR